MINQGDIQGQYAGFISRFIAFVLDLIIISLLSFLVTAFLGLIINFFGLNSVMSNLPGGRLWATLQQLILLAGMLFTSCFGLIYFLFFWVVAGFTPGKGLLGLRVMRLDGQPLTFWPALLRFIGYWVSALCLFRGFFWIIFDRRRQGWHDKFARTVVVYDWQPRLMIQPLPKPLDSTLSEPSLHR
jgi:uncharacterized RDD family membrane protein YckC